MPAVPWLEPCRPAGPEPEPEWDEPGPDYLEGERDLVELRLIAPPKLVISMESFGRFPGVVGRIHEALAFQLAGAADEVVAQLTVSWRDVHTVERQLRAFFPEADLTRREDSFPERLAACEAADAFAAFEFGQRREYLLPLATFRALEDDPLIRTARVAGRFATGRVCGLTEHPGELRPTGPGHPGARGPKGRASRTTPNRRVEKQ